MLSSNIQNQTEPKFFADSREESSPAERYSAEKSLIIACSRTDFGFEEISRVMELLDEKLSWEYIFTTAFRNGVLPLVAWNLLKNFGGDLPTDIKEKLGRFFHEHAANNLFLTGKLIKIIKLLGEAGIPVLPFKGVTLAQRAYKNPALRQFVDLDVLVQPKHFDKAIRVLTANDFHLPDEKRKTDATGFFFNRRKDIGFISGDGRVRLELHWKLSGAHFALPFELDELWARLEKIKIGGSHLNVLAFDDLFVYLCLHAARHGFERLAWIADLRELINSRESDQGKIEWAEIARHARRYGCEKVVELGVFLIGEFYGERLEYPHVEQIAGNPVFQKIAVRLREKLFSDEWATTEIGDWYWYHLHLKERKLDRLKLHLHYFLWYLRLALTPNDKDKAIFRLPAVFYPLYFILRPSRLLLKRFK